MSKRFIDTDIFRKEFVQALEAPYKLLWLYIINECNHAGIWEVELQVAEIRLGVKFSTPPAEIFKEKIIVISPKKWFIPSFIEFQYGELNPQNRAHNSVIQLLKKYNLLNETEGASKPLTSPLEGAMDKVKDKDKDMEKEKGGKKPIFKYDLSFLESHPFKDCFMAWLTYKRERRENYKSQETLEIAFHHLIKISNNNKETATTIVTSAIAGNIQGLYPVKNTQDGNKRTSKNYDDLIAENRAAFAGTGEGNNSATGWHRPATD